MSVDTRKEEAEIIDIQIIASFLFIITIITSIFLNINEKNQLLGKKTILSREEASSLLKTNRIIIVALFFTYFYLSYKSREIDEINGKDLTPDNLELFVSFLSIIGGLIVLYLVFNYDENTTAIYENPTI